MSSHTLTLGQVECHKRWSELVATARAAAKAGAAMDRPSLQRAVIQTGPRAPFPIAGDGPRRAAEGLRSLAQAYAETTLESRLYAIGDALTAAALCADQLLDEPAIERARLMSARIGERED